MKFPTFAPFPPRPSCDREKLRPLLVGPSRPTGRQPDGMTGSGRERPGTRSDERCIERQTLGPYSKPPCLSITEVVIALSQRPAREAAFFCCDFWRSRRRHIWRPPRLPHHTLRRSTDVQAVPSPLSDQPISSRQSLP